LYSTTNGGSRYTFDPDYGGKVSMPTGHQAAPLRPDTMMSRAAPDASRPRALFADDRSRYVANQASTAGLHLNIAFLSGDEQCESMVQTSWKRHMCSQGALARACSRRSFQDLCHNACVCLTCSTASCFSESKMVMSS